MNGIVVLLSKIDSKILLRALGSDRLEELQKLLPAEGSKSESLNSKRLAEFALALFGNDILYEKKIRTILFQLLPPEKLKDLAAKFARTTHEKPYDNALALSSCSWSSGSDLVYEIARHLNIPKGYLPKSATSFDTVELVEPIDRLRPLHDYQEQMKRDLLKNLNKSRSKTLLQMPTGSGKTRTVIETLFEHASSNDLFAQQKNILWLAHTEELCEQAIDTFKEVWSNLSNNSVQVVRCWGSYNPKSFDLMGSFVVASFQKMHSLRKREEEKFRLLVESADVLVIDEAHKILAPTYKEVFDLFSGKDQVHLLGLTATPGRGTDREEENSALARIFDKNLVTPRFKTNAITALRDKGVLANLSRVSINSGVDIDMNDDEIKNQRTGGDLTPTVIKRLAADTARNRIILHEIERQVKTGNPCLVFSCSTAHSRLLSAALNLKGVRSGHIDCEMRKGSRRRIIDEFRSGEFDVLLNYGVLSTGFDAPRIRSVIVTRPTTSVVLYSQMIGRGLRGPLMGGGADCCLIDIEDNFTNFGGVEEVYAYFDGYWKK